MSHKWRAVIGTLCVLGATAVVLHITQHIILKRIQRTADEVQHIEIGKANACSAFHGWQNEWRSQLSFEGTCDDANHFYMDIDVQYPPKLLPTCMMESANGMRFVFHQAICSISRIFTGKPIAYTARIEATKGIVTRKVSQVFTLVPDGSPGAVLPVPAILNGLAETSSELHSHGHAQSAMQQQKFHPDYLAVIGETRVNADYMPGLRVFFIKAEVTSAASADKLFHFDLSCIERVRTCSRKDLMPYVYEQYTNDEMQSVAQPQQ